MNIKEYIASGVLELYVAGMLSGSEAEEVRRMAEKHPEVAAEIQSIEQSLGQYAEGFSPEPPGQHILEGALAEIETEEMAAVKPLSPSFPPLAWAAVIFLALSFGLNVYQFVNQGELKGEIADLQLKTEQLEAQIDQGQKQLAYYESLDFQRIPLENAESGAKAIVLWNENTQEVLIKALELPEAGTDQQFQLWAINGEGPNSVGVFDFANDSLQFTVAEEGIAAFAISLEPRGGSESPTTDQILVVGKV